MSLFAIGDLHLSLSPEVDKPMDVFGPRWHDHVNRLRRNWLELVAPEDTVILAGDLSWGMRLREAEPDLEWIDALPGRKILFKGNHDLWWTGVRKLNSMYATMQFVQNDCATGEGLYICGTRGWLTPDSDEYTADDESVYRRECLRLQMSLEAARKLQAERGEPGGEILGVLHYPPVSKRTACSGFMELFREYGVREVIYGHIHGEEGFRSCIQGEYYGTRYRLVSLDHLNCVPCRLR